MLLASTAILFIAILWVATAGLTIGAAVAAATTIAVVVGLIWHKLRGAVSTGSGPYRVLELMERSRESRRNSIRDESTGLLNRWYLERRLDEEAARCKRYGYSMAVVVVKCSVVDLAGISLDGWQTESAAAAHRCAQVIRDVDLSASLAPFEFAICLIHCDREGAEAAIHRIVKELAEYNCTIGISVYPADDCQPKALIDLARVRAREMDAPAAAAS